MSGLYAWPWKRMPTCHMGWWRWVAIIGFVVAGLVAVGHGQAPDPGRIQGTVRQQGQSIAHHRIMLIRFGPGQDVQRTPGQTGAEGRFAFDHLATGTDFQYVVGVRY